MKREPLDRIDSDQALSWLESEPTSTLMALADARRRALHGNRTFYVHSYNLNPTNLCENRCRFCAFRRERGTADAYVMTLDIAREKLLLAGNADLTDLHIVGGIAPELDLAYYEQLLGLAGTILPGVLIQGMTAVEIHSLAAQAGLSILETLQRLRAAGLRAISGGGAEIFADGIRRRICPDKISADQWLTVHAAAHGLGIPTNATMLFGHIESDADIIDHLSRLRDLQDQTSGFRAFIPIPFQAAHNDLEIPNGPAGDRIARVTAVSRLFLDNVPHIRVLINYMERKLLAALTHGGADDIGGTSLDEQIARAAGAPKGHTFSEPCEMKEFIRGLGLEPVLTNSAYDGVAPLPVRKIKLDHCLDLLAKARNGERLTADESVRLYDHAPMAELGKAANGRRQAMVPGDRVTFVIDRNLSITNVCEAGCRFCAFHVQPGAEGAFALTVDQIVQAAREAETAGATQLLIQGGLNPDFTIAFYEEALSRLKAETGLWLHSLSPAEIVYMAGRAQISIDEALARLRAAGLDSLPGGGAEILVDEVRRRVSPRKIGADQWFHVMRVAHGMAMRTTATMVYGLGESPAQRVEHLLRVRDLQDETGGFTAFIPWSFQPGGTGVQLPQQTGVDYLRMVALSRIVLDNVPHIQSGWVTEGPDLAQLALSFGADDFGGVLMEEQVVRATGVSYSVTLKDVIRLIRATGMVPAQRTTQYELCGQRPISGNREQPSC